MQLQRLFSIRGALEETDVKKELPVLVSNVDGRYYINLGTVGAGVVALATADDVDRKVDMVFVRNGQLTDDYTEVETVRWSKRVFRELFDLAMVFYTSPDQPSDPTAVRYSLSVV